MRLGCDHHSRLHSNQGPQRPVPASRPPADPEGRQYYLDWLRVIAFGILIFYHVGMFYVTWDWYLKSRYSSVSWNRSWS